MTNKTTFNKSQEKNFKTLNQYVPVVAKVHGSTHAEFHEVRKLYNIINEKAEEITSEKLELEQEFARLREITNHYAVPSDVCESYEAVYKMLSELDEAYHSELKL